MKSLIWISVLSLVFISALIQKVASDLPHCSLTTAIIAQVQRLDLDTDEIQLTTSVQVALNVRETACFRIYFDESAENLGENSSDSSSIYYQYNGSLLYTFTYQSLEQQYPVKSQYEFALPVLAGNCVCDCPGGEDHCNGAHEHKNCSLQNDSMGICVTTYHPHQPTTGCFSDTSDGELCCQVIAKPFDAHRYHAIRLSQPSNVIVMEYGLYRNDEILDRRNLPMVINGNRVSLELPEHKLRLMISGADSSRTLPEQIYFGLIDEYKKAYLRTDLPINHQYEWNLGKLGWFRWEEPAKRWDVRSSGIKLRNAHRATAIDCKNQIYVEKFDAEFFYTLEDDPQKFADLGILVSEFYEWIETAIYQSKFDRHVDVRLRNPPEIRLDIQLVGNPQIILGHHESDLKDFFGKILLDRFSNRFLNVTFLNAKGTLVGGIFFSQERDRLDSPLSDYVNSRTLINMTKLIELPGHINSSRWVCFYPSGEIGKEKCHEIEFFEEPLHWFVLPKNLWRQQQGNCPGCNEISAANFLKYLNPQTWFSGFSSISEAIAMAVDIVIYALVIILFVALIRRLIWPLLKFILCDSKVGPEPKIGSGTLSTRKTAKAEEVLV